MRGVRRIGYDIDMATQALPRESWRTYFDELSRTIGATEVTVEVAGRDLGDQIAAEQLLLVGITYDDGDDILVVALDAAGDAPGDYEHEIDSPQQIRVAELEDGTTTIEVIDPDDNQHLVYLRPAPELPPA
jgi:hypothetical protein